MRRMHIAYDEEDTERHLYATLVNISYWQATYLL